MAEDERLLGFVSNRDRPVYAIRGLPEEVVAVIFAYVSRSPASFRENLGRLLADDELAVGAEPISTAAFASASATASRFHERWVVQYGHASVAEHATVHLGVEGVSRIASAELELAGSFLSFTEFSQRYQRPRRGAYVVPDELPPQYLDRYRAFQEEAFDCYEQLTRALKAFHMARGAEEREAERAAFEDARYALPLAVATALGLSANARALREAIVTLRGSPHGEVRRLADALAAEGASVVPTLLRHLEEALFRPRVDLSVSETELLDFTGRGAPEPEAEALGALGLSAPEELPSPGPYDLLPTNLDQVRYRFRLAPSEAAWHQLLRHNRRTDFLYADPDARRAIVVPPAVDEVGGTARLEALADASRALFTELCAVAPSAAPYVVLNAHRRPLAASLSLRELLHLWRLRGAENAQWEIRGVVGELWRLAAAVHPRLTARLGARAEEWHA